MDTERSTTEHRKKVFLDHFRRHANISRAAAAAGISRPLPYQWRQRDPEFDHAYHQAELEFLDALEAAALDAATNGRRFMRIYRDGKGEVQRTIEEIGISEQMLMMLLRARAPYRYGVPGIAPAPYVEEKPRPLTLLELRALTAATDEPHPDD